MIIVVSMHYLQVNDSEPYVVWLSGLHIPESYLTALVQATCRRNQWPLDKSTLYTSVTEVSRDVCMSLYLRYKRRGQPPFQK